jgi:hypothetical protein
MKKTKIFFFEDRVTDFQRLEKELTSSGIYEVIPSILTNGKYPYKELADSLAKNTYLDYVNKIIQENWDDGLKIIICDLLKKEINIGNALIEKIRCDDNFCVNECKSFSGLIPIIVYTHADNDCIDDALKSGANFYFQKLAVTSDPIIEKENKDKMEKFKKIIKDQINYFDKKLSLVKNEVPPQIREKVKEFKTKHKDKTTAFIMTRFSDKHTKTIKTIRKILDDNNIIGHIANAPGGEYHGNLFPNIQVYLHGCDFGIAIYDDILGLSSPDSEPIINANLSLEVGYMLALQKEVALLKDKSLSRLNSDLNEKIYILFDMTNPSGLKDDLLKWLENNKFMVK